MPESGLAWRHVCRHASSKHSNMRGRLTLTHALQHDLRPHATWVSTCHGATFRVWLITVAVSWPGLASPHCSGLTRGRPNHCRPRSGPEGGGLMWEQEMWAWHEGKWTLADFHWHYFFVYMSLWLVVYLSVFPVVYLSVCLYICLSMYVWLSICLSLWLSIYLSVWLSIYLSVWMSTYLSVWLSVYCLLFRCSPSLSFSPK